MGLAVGFGVCVGVAVGRAVGVGVSEVVGWIVDVGVAVASERGDSDAVTVVLTTSVDGLGVEVEASVDEVSGANEMVANTRRMVTSNFSLPLKMRPRASCHFWMGTTSKATSMDV